jgi:hypothetical protein
MTSTTTRLPRETGSARPRSSSLSPCPWLWLCLCAALLGPGCRPGTPEQPEEHSHHDIPGHYPRTYAVAVRNLRLRLEELAPVRPGPAVTPARLDQFADLLRWLPSLALETDMTQHPWTRLVASVRRAEELLVQHRSGLLAGAPENRQQFRAGLEPELAIWEDLLPVATDQIFRPLDDRSESAPTAAERTAVPLP